MADRIVYLVQKLTPAMQADGSLSFVDDAGFSELVAAGWEVVSQREREVQVGSKRVKADMIVLRQAADNRGVSVVRGRDRGDLDGGGGTVTVRDDFGQARTLSPIAALAQVADKIGRALANVGSASHLGAPGRHDMPGLQIVSGEIVAKAFDLGVTAATRGHGADSNPFDPKSEAGQQWLRGFRSVSKAGRAGVTPEALETARASGARAAQDFGPDDEVTCPYPLGSPLRNAWVEGFRANGGRVED